MPKESKQDNKWIKSYIRTQHTLFLYFHSNILLKLREMDNKCTVNVHFLVVMYLKVTWSVFLSIFNFQNVLREIHGNYYFQ